MIKNNSIKIVGLLVTLAGLAVAVYFFLPVKFDPNPQVWFSATYYLQFIPLYIAVTFLLCGFFIFMGYSRVNLYLAVFGHATSEEILFSWLGLTVSPLPTYAMYIFFPFSLVALWLAYSNVLKKKPVSVAEAVFGIVFSTAFILFPRFL